jgi:lantibiotic modifying enzyme
MIINKLNRIDCSSLDICQLFLIFLQKKLENDSELREFSNCQSRINFRNTSLRWNNLQPMGSDLAFQAQTLNDLCFFLI